MASLCQVCADTNLVIEKCIFQSDLLLRRLTSISAASAFLNLRWKSIDFWYEIDDRRFKTREFIRNMLCLYLNIGDSGKTSSFSNFAPDRRVLEMGYIKNPPLILRWIGVCPVLVRRVKLDSVSSKDFFYFFHAFIYRGGYLFHCKAVFIHLLNEFG